MSDDESRAPVSDGFFDESDGLRPGVFPYGLSRSEPGVYNNPIPDEMHRSFQRMMGPEPSPEEVDRFYAKSVEGMTKEANEFIAAIDQYRGGLITSLDFQMRAFLVMDRAMAFLMSEQKIKTDELIRKDHEKLMGLLLKQRGDAGTPSTK